MAASAASRGLAHLPGVKTGQPELYETPDVPASTTRVVRDLRVAGEAPASAADVDAGANPAVRDALQTFAQFGAGHVSRAQPQVFGVGGPQREETPLERLHRLQAEVKAFAAEVGQLSAAAPDTVVEEDVSAAQLMGELRSLEARLVQSGSRVPAPVQRDVVAKLQSSVAGLDAPVSAGVSASATAGLLDSEAAARVAAAEQRLARLEAALGSSAGEPLTVSLAQLQKKVALLDEQKLDLLSSRAGVVSSELDALVKKQQAATEIPSHLQHEKRINEIYDTLKRWDATSALVPGLIARLSSLSALHNDAAVFVEVASTMSEEQQRLAAQLAENKELLDLVQTNFKQNAAVLLDNVKNLEGRLAKLSS